MPESDVIDAGESSRKITKKSLTIRMQFYLV